MKYKVTKKVISLVVIILFFLPTIVFARAAACYVTQDNTSTCLGEVANVENEDDAFHACTALCNEMGVQAPCNATFNQNLETCNQFLQWCTENDLTCEIGGAPAEVRSVACIMGSNDACRTVPADDCQNNGDIIIPNVARCDEVVFPGGVATYSELRNHLSSPSPSDNLPTSNAPANICKTPKPTNYKGPLPDCAFCGECRGTDQLVLLFINIGKFILSLLGTIAFVMFIYGGVTMIMSFGSADKFKKGQNILVAAVVGILIALSAYLAVDFILEALKVSDSFKAVQ